MVKKISIIFFLLFSVLLFSQEHQFIGLIKFDKSNIISYRLEFSLKNGKIAGYSITDFHGENETKNRISGFYDSKTKLFNFVEKEIVYTKSKIIQNDFCFLNFKGKVNLKEKISGEFSSLFNDGKVCLKGTLNLVSNEKAKQRIMKVDKKIQKSNRVTAEQKKEIKLDSLVDNLKLNVLNKDELTSIYVASDEIELEIWDSKTEDGDKVSVDFDGKNVLNNYEILNKKKLLKLKLNKETSILKIRANNVGEFAPNTAKINVFDGDKNIELITKLDMNDVTTIQIIKAK